jgi:hypothetical protein
MQSLIIEHINRVFQDILCSEEHHLFFRSFQWWQEAKCSFSRNPNITQELIRTVDPDENTYSHRSDNFIPQPIPYHPYHPQNTITPEKLHELYDIVSNATDFSVVREKLESLYDFNLPSTISDPEAHFTLAPTIKVLIAGAGPVGLFTALYLNDYYNRSVLFKGKKVEILVIDSRIHADGVRLPYSRLTQFGFDIGEIQRFVKNIYCWQDTSRSKSDRHFDFINVLENLLYITAFHRNIPMYFTQRYKNWEAIKAFMGRHNIGYVFDCTGGRLVGHSGTIQFSTIDETKSSFIHKEGDTTYAVKLVPNEGIYRFHINDIPYSYKVMVLQLFDKDMRQFPVGNFFGHPKKRKDAELIARLNNKCFRTQDYVTASRGFSSRRLRFLLPYIMKNVLADKVDVMYVRVTTFDVCSYHASFAARSFEDGKRVYVAMGNTLGSSEYGIQYGMKVGLLFSKHVCHLLTV